MNSSNSQSDSTVEIGRRQFLYTTAGVTALGVIGSTGAVQADTDSEILYENNFEARSVGDVPSEFVLAGNTDQEVVDMPVATGDRSYRMSGSHGGCWQAIARFPFSVESRMQIRGQYRLVGGEEGCHSGRGHIRLIDEISTRWSVGDGPTLLSFDSDNVVRSAGTEIGEYTDGEWISFEIIYHRDSDAGEVTHRSRINDGEWKSSTRGTHSAEDDLIGLQLASRDFTVMWDDIVIEQYVDESDPDSPLAKYTDDEGYVDSEGLLDAGADFRAGEIDASTVEDIASAFRSGTPLDT